jgi:hypothetical protein
MQVLGYALTYHTVCRDCGTSIFFHTNGHGDAVFFDELGPPWLVHKCSGAPGSQSPSDWHAYRAYMVRLYGQTSRPVVASHKITRISLRPRPKKLDHTTALRPSDIERCAPGNFIGQTLDITGFVHDIHTGWAVSRFSEEGSIGYAHYRRLIGNEAYSQVTLIDSDLMSYTIIVPRARLELQRGAIVSACIKGVSGLRESMFLCQSISAVRFERA